MKTGSVQKAGLDLMRGVLLSLSMFIGSRRTSAPSGGSAPQRSSGNTSGSSSGNSAKDIAVEKFKSGLLLDIRNAFTNKLNPVTGEPWPARTRDYPHEMMIETGALKQGALDAVQSARVYQTGVEIDFTDPFYGFIHMVGSDKTNLPIRRFIGASQQTFDETTKSVLGAVEQLFINWK